jgi:CheY-like chemotaxis protein
MPDYTILLIDYDPDSAERLRRPLMRAGYRVEIACDGLDGISRFHEITPHLTLIEAMIPKMHGFDVCQAVKKTPHGQRSAVWILTSVYKGQKYRTQAFLHYKCDEYLEKPISEDELVASVNGYFEELACRPEVVESQDSGAAVMSFDPARGRALPEDAPAPATPGLLPAREATYGGGGQSAAAPELSVPEPALEPLVVEIPDESEIPSDRGAPKESKRGRLLLWIALALLAALGGLLVVTVLL